jgi:HSP20 family protein
MALVSFRGLSPLDGLLELQSSLERLLDQPGLGLNLGPSAGGLFPALNIFEDPSGGVIFRAEIPGIAPEDLDVTVEPGRLSLGGERRAPEGKRSYHRRERRFGRFSRTVQLPEGLDPAQVTAECRDGVLSVRIARSEAAKPRQVKIQAR